MSDALNVFFGENLVGVVHRQADDRLAFEYADSWLDDPQSFSISISLPLVAGLNHGRASHAFFANLLPEGNLRVAVARKLGISISNDFALLEAIGGECAGALSILPVSKAPYSFAGGYERLEPGVLAEMARRFSVFPEITEHRQYRLSLAGAQDKLPIRYDEDGSFWLPIGDSPSTHILKVPSRDFKHLPANEVLVTKLARALSLTTVCIDLLRIDDIEIALVQRYDRISNQNHITRLHQEDMCQALGLQPSTKYENEGGPTFFDVMRLVRQWSTNPLVDGGRLLRWFVFSMLVGNADGHAKNLSFLYSENGIRLAPFYDLVCTHVYPRIIRHIAMAIAGKKDPGLIRRADWERLAEELDIGKHLIFSEIETLAVEIPKTFDKVADAYAARHGDSPIIQRIRRSILKQCRRTLTLMNR